MADEVKILKSGCDETFLQQVESLRTRYHFQLHSELFFINLFIDHSLNFIINSRSPNSSKKYLQAIPEAFAAARRLLSSRMEKFDVNSLTREENRENYARLLLDINSSLIAFNIEKKKFDNTDDEVTKSIGELRSYVVTFSSEFIKKHYELSPSTDFESDELKLTNFVSDKEYEKHRQNLDDDIWLPNEDDKEEISQPLRSHEKNIFRRFFNDSKVLQSLKNLKFYQKKMFGMTKK